jgi:hypothetical protein
LKRILLRLLLIGVALGAAVILVETGLRVTGIEYTNFYRHDLVCGSALRPGAEGWWRDEGVAHIEINSRGLRDREHQLLKTPQTFRIALLGDSYAEAMQVELDQTFWMTLANELTSCPALAGREVELINFGVAGYGTAQELLTLRHKVWQYAPDLVVLAFVSGNDVRNNSRVLEGDLFRPYYLTSGQGLVLDDSFLREPAFVRRTGLAGRSYASLRNRVRVVQLARRAISRLGSSRTALEARATHWEPGLDDAVYLSRPDPVWQDAWAITEKLILEIRDDVQQQDAGFLMVMVSNGIQVHPDAALREAFERSLEAASLDYPETRLTALSVREGFDLLALAPLMRAHAEREATYLHGFGSPPGRGHWNVAGHRLAGRLIAEHICSTFSSQGRQTLFGSPGTLYDDAGFELKGGPIVDGL